MEGDTVAALGEKAGSFLLEARHLSLITIRIIAAELEILPQILLA